MCVYGLHGLDLGELCSKNALLCYAVIQGLERSTIMLPQGPMLFLVQISDQESLLYSGGEPHMKYLPLFLANLIFNFLACILIPSWQLTVPI